MPRKKTSDSEQQLEQAVKTGSDASDPIEVVEGWQKL
jgi:hypothetical protein